MKLSIHTKNMLVLRWNPSIHVTVNVYTVWTVCVFKCTILIKIFIHQYNPFSINTESKMYILYILCQSVQISVYILNGQNLEICLILCNIALQ